LEDFEATHMLRSRESTVYTDLQLCARCENHPGEKQCLPTSFISQGTWQVLQAERQVAMLVKAPANCPTLGGMSGEKSQQSGKGCEAWSIGAETACTWEAAQATGAWVRRGITVPAFGDKTGDYCGVVAQGKAVCERKDGGGSGEPITDQYEAVTMLPLWTRSIKYCYNPLPQED
jgi:hypothetical protein